MKILYILSGTTIYGGATKSFNNLIHYLKTQGVHISVVCPDKNGIYTILQNEGIPVYSLPYYFATSSKIKGISSIFKYIPKKMRNIACNYYSYRKLISICNKVRPDIIHTNSSVINIGFKVAQRLGLPHIYHIREYGMLDFGLDTSYVINHLLRDNSFSISITKGILTEKRLRSHNNVVIYNGIINPESFRYTDNKDKYYLFAGRIEPTKGLEDLLHAYASYITKSKNPYKLIIAGEYNQKLTNWVNHLKDYIKQNNLEYLIEWVGNRSDIFDLMYKASATIIPSKFEGFGRVMPEAMANGCLCIAKNTAGSKEQLDNGIIITGSEIGKRFNTPEELSSILLETEQIKSEDLRMIISNAQKTIQELYTNEKNGQLILDFYKKILHQS